MADRYWVGGTGNWSDDEHHWATSSNGSPGIGNLPTSSDDVFIDSNSGFGAGGTITEDGETTRCRDFTSTSGHNYNIEYGASDIEIYGSAVFESGTTFNSDAWTQFYGTGTHTITINGASIDYVGIYGSGTFTLQDDLVITDNYEQQNGKFDANNNNITAGAFYFEKQTGDNTEVVMGSGTWEVTSNDDSWYVNQFDSETLSIDSGTSTIKFTDTTALRKELIFYTEEGSTSVTYNKVWFTGAETGGYLIQGSHNISEFVVDTPPHSIKVTSGSTITVNTFNVSGTSGNLITFNVLAGSDQFYLSKASGTVVCDYLDLSNSNTEISLDQNLTLVSDYITFGNNAQEKVAQTYKPSITGNRTRIDINLYKVNAPTDNFLIKIYSDNTGSPDELLATSTNVISGTTLNTGWGNQIVCTFNFSGVELTANTTYWIVVERSGSLDDTNYYRIISADEATDPYTNGEAFTLNDGAWSAYSDGGFFYDLWFKEYYSGGATWYAGSHSEDTTNNDGWIFTSSQCPFPTFHK